MFAIIKNKNLIDNTKNSNRLLELFKERKNRQEKMRQEKMRQEKMRQEKMRQEEEVVQEDEEEEVVQEDQAKKLNKLFFNINAIKPIFQQPSELMLQVLKDHEDLQVKINNNKTMLSKFKSINVIKH